MWIRTVSCDLGLGSLFQRRIHRLEAALRRREHAAEKRHEQAGKALQLAEGAAVAAALQFEGVLAIEDAGQQQLAQPPEFLLGPGHDDRRPEGHGRLARRLDLYAEPRTRLGCALDPGDEGVPLVEAGEVGEYTPDECGRAAISTRVAMRCMARAAR